MNTQIFINEFNIGIKVTRAEADLFISFLSKKGYAVEYSLTPAEYPIKVKNRDWIAAQDYLSSLVDDTTPAKPVAPVRNYSELSLAERIEFLGNACNYLTAKLETAVAA